MPVAATVTTWTALTAIGTFVAVVVALFLDELRVLRRRWRRPQLRLTHSVENSWIENHVVPISTTTLGVIQRAAYLRFAVSNRVARDAARDVEVLLARVEQVDHRGEVIRQIHVASPPFGWANVERTALTIPPGVARFVDIGILVGPADPAGARQRERDERLRLGIAPEPADQRHLLAPGRYRLRLVVTALNADARQYETELEFDADWPRDEAAIWQHLRVVEPPRRIASSPPPPRRARATSWLRPDTK